MDYARRECHVMQVDRAYNNIVREVNPEERRLVVDPIRQLDRVWDFSGNDQGKAMDDPS